MRQDRPQNSQRSSQKAVLNKFLHVNAILDRLGLDLRVFGVDVARFGLQLRSNLAPKSAPEPPKNGLLGVSPTDHKVVVCFFVSGSFSIVMKSRNLPAELFDPSPEGFSDAELDFARSSKHGMKSWNRPIGGLFI